MQTKPLTCLCFCSLSLVYPDINPTCLIHVMVLNQECWCRMGLIPWLGAAFGTETTADSSSETENKAPSQCRAPASPVPFLPLGEVGSHLSQRDTGAERDQGAQCRGCPPKPDCFLSGASGRNPALPPRAQCLGYLKQRALWL